MQLVGKTCLFTRNLLLQLFKLYIYFILFCIYSFYIWYIRERLFVERMHQKKMNSETLGKIWFLSFAPWLPSSMSNHDRKWVFYYFYYIMILELSLVWKKCPLSACKWTEQYNAKRKSMKDYKCFFYQYSRVSCLY